MEFLFLEAERSQLGKKDVAEEKTRTLQTQSELLFALSSVNGLSALESNNSAVPVSLRRVLEARSKPDRGCFAEHG